MEFQCHQYTNGDEKRTKNQSPGRGTIKQIIRALFPFVIQSFQDSKIPRFYCFL